MTIERKENMSSSSSSSDVYRRIRDDALNKLLLDFVTENSSFTFDRDFNDDADGNVHGLPGAYSALSALNLNEEKTWNLMKSKLKPLAVCVICESRVNWEHGEMADDGSDLDEVPKRKSCTDIESINR